MLSNPAKGIFRGTNKSLTCVYARSEFFIPQRFDAVALKDFASHAVRQHRLPATFQIFDKLRSRKRLVNDHHKQVLSSKAVERYVHRINQ